MSIISCHMCLYEKVTVSPLCVEASPHIHVCRATYQEVVSFKFLQSMYGFVMKYLFFVLCICFFHICFPVWNLHIFSTPQTATNYCSYSNTVRSYLHLRKVVMSERICTVYFLCYNFKISSL